MAILKMATKQNERISYSLEFKQKVLVEVNKGRKKKDVCHSIDFINIPQRF